jgi:hypothetical protein
MIVRTVPLLSLLLCLSTTLLLCRQSNAFIGSSSSTNGGNSLVWCQPYQSTATQSLLSVSPWSRVRCCNSRRHLLPMVPISSSHDNLYLSQHQQQHTSFSTATTTTTRRFTSTQLFLSPKLPESARCLLSILFQNRGPIPLVAAFGWNVCLFVVLRTQLFKVLTLEGYVHALVLGSMLWYTLGWKGWTLCVLYLGLGSLVTKIQFQEKQMLGIAEGREGRRGPENVWYVKYIIVPTHVYNMQMPMERCCQKAC